MKQYFVEQAETYEEACRKVREKYGDQAAILLRKSVVIRGGFLGLFSREGVEVSGPVPASMGKESPHAPVLPNRQFSLNEAASFRPVRRQEVFPRTEGDFQRESGPKEPWDLEAEKRKILAAAGRGDPTLQMVLSEVRNIKEKMDAQNVPQAVLDGHPVLQRIEDILVLNDFSPAYRAEILGRAKKEFSLDELDDYDAVQDKILEWIGESISIHRENDFHALPRIIVLVGPTGVGKTTTIAKLAANFGIDDTGRRIRQVVLITIDAFRIGAKHQLEAYSNILEFPCFAVEDYDELKRTIAINSDGTDIIIVDTIGKSPRDMVKLGEMKQLLDACGSLAEVHLAVTAATKYSDLAEILRHFEPFNYRSVVVTKLDETLRTGNIISVLAERGKSVSYITNGQKVPADIQKASVMQFLTNLEGFRVNRIKLEELFPNNDSEQLRQWR